MLGVMLATILPLQCPQHLGIFLDGIHVLTRGKAIERDSKGFGGKGNNLLDIKGRQKVNGITFHAKNIIQNRILYLIGREINRTSWII